MYWTKQCMAGCAFSCLRRNFLASPERSSKCTGWIIDVFHKYLGREASSNDKMFWKKKCVRGCDRDCLTREISAFNEFNSQPKRKRCTTWVTDAFQNIWHRPKHTINTRHPFYVTVLDRCINESCGRTCVNNMFIDSPQYEQFERAAKDKRRIDGVAAAAKERKQKTKKPLKSPCSEWVRSEYRMALNRAPSSSEGILWTKRCVNQGCGPTCLRDALHAMAQYRNNRRLELMKLAVAERQAKSQSKGKWRKCASAISNAYRQLLRRNAGDSELAYFGRQCMTGKCGSACIYQQVKQSAEYIERGTRAKWAERSRKGGQGAASCKQLVTSAYKVFFRRAPGPIGFKYWNGRCGRGCRWSCLASNFQSSEEFHEAALLARNERTHKENKTKNERRKKASIPPIPTLTIPPLRVPHIAVNIDTLPQLRGGRGRR